MQTNRLFINGIEIQLSEQTKIGLTKQANNIGELQNRQGDFTNTFRIPMNAHNRERLEHANIQTSASQLPYQKLRITYIEDGFEIISNGEGSINSADARWMYIDCKGGNINLVRSIGERTVGELFGSGVSHTWDFTTVKDSRDGSEDYIYPLIDWRTDQSFFDTATIFTPRMLPCLRMPAVFGKIEELTGYTFKGSYIDGPVHAKMVLTPDELTVNDDFSQDVEASFATVTPSEVEVLEGSGYIAPVNVAVTMGVNGSGFFNGSYYPAANEAGKLRFTGLFATRQVYINGGLGLLETPQTREFWFVVQIKEAGTVLAETTYPHFIGTVYELDSFQNTVIDLETPEIVLSAGVQYYVNIEIHAEKHGNADTQIEFGFAEFDAKFVKSPISAIVYGNPIRFVDLFRMKAIEVLKDVLNLRGLIIQTNAYTREVWFNYFDDLITNKAIALDWSHLVDVGESKKLQMVFKFGNYGQRNNFIFKENDQVSAGLGNSYFTINDTTLPDEITAVQLNHSATEQTPKFNGKIIPEIEAIETNLNKWQDPGWRLLQLETQPTSYSVTYSDGINSSVENTNIPFARFVGFDETIPEFYDALTGILENTKGVPIIFKLSPDVNRLSSS